MGKAKRKRAKKNQARKKFKPLKVQKTREMRHKLLPYLCNQFTYGHIGPKK